MSDTDTTPARNDALDELRSLITTALYNTDYYPSDEGYWYQRDVFYADLAIAEIARRLAGRDIAGDELALLREAIAAPGVRLAAVEALLSGLKEQAAPLVADLLADPTPERRATGVRLAPGALGGNALAMLREAIAAPDVPLAVFEAPLKSLKEQAAPLIADLLADPAPERRAMAVRLAPGALEAAHWLPALDDPHPQVRRTAVAMLIAAHRQPDDDPSKPGDYKAHLRRALGDPDPAVRRAAAASTARYVDRERNAVLASLIEQEPDAAQRRGLLGLLIQAADWPDGLHDPAVRAALLRGLGHDDVGIRRLAVDKLAHRMLYAGAGNDLTDICVAMFERLLIEPEFDVARILRDSAGYARISGIVIARLTALLQDDPPRVTHLVYFLRQFGAASVPLLRHLAAQPGPVSVQAQMSLDAIEAASDGA